MPSHLQRAAKTKQHKTNKKGSLPCVKMSHEAQRGSTLQGALSSAGPEAEHRQVLRGLKFQRTRSAGGQRGQEGILQTPSVHIQNLQAHKKPFAAAIVAKKTDRQPGLYLQIFLYTLQEHHSGSKFFKLGLEFQQH